MLMNKLYAKLADVCYEAGRKFQRKSFTVKTKSGSAPIFKKERSTSAGAMGTLPLDIKDPEIRDAIAKGYSRAIKDRYTVSPRVTGMDSEWNGPNYNGQNLEDSEEGILVNMNQPSPIAEAEKELGL